jgi:hypothetical protein
MGTYVPPEWPAGVHPPGSEDFESTAVGWLLDVVPPDYRLHGVLRRYPIALATMARYHAKACVEGARQGYRTARTDLGSALPPHAVDTVLAAYRKEGARLAAIASAVDLVERALRGEVFTPEMGSAESSFAGPGAGSQRAASGGGARTARAREPEPAEAHGATGAREAARTRGAAGAGSGRAEERRDAGGGRDAGSGRKQEAETAGGRGAERREAGRPRKTS